MRSSRFGGEAGDFAAGFGGEFFQERFRKKRDIAQSLAERRKNDVDNVNAIIEILAEAAFFDQNGEVLVAGEDDADIDSDGVIGADRFKFPLLEHAQQLHLETWRGGIYFIQKNRPAIGGEETALFVVGRAGEGAFDVAEEFGFEERFRNRAAGNFDERLLGAGRTVVEGPGDERFAGAGFAGS